MEYGESSAEAAAREVKEETGLFVHSSGLRRLGHTEDWFADEGKHCITLWFAGEVLPNTEARITEPDKVTKMRWITKFESLPGPLFLPLANYLWLNSDFSD